MGVHNQLSPSSSRGSDDGEGQSDDKVEVEYFANEKSFKQRLHAFFFKNRRSSLVIRSTMVVLKLLTCVCYVVRVQLDEGPLAAKCYGCPANNITDADSIEKGDYLQNPHINYLALVWVTRPFELWLIQLFFSIVSLIRTFLIMFLIYKVFCLGNVLQLLLSPLWLLECVTSVPFVATLLSPSLRNLFVPMFLNCWIAKIALANLMSDLHRAIQKTQSAVAQQIIVLSSTFACLVFTAACGIQHFQRAGRANMTLFQSVYFSVVTFSTVGYGEFYPDIWISQLLVILIICVAFIVLPKQVEQLALTWMEKQKSGGEYSMHRAKSEKHVVVSTNFLKSDTTYDFLNELYAHPMLQDYFVLLLSPNDLDVTMKVLLQVPLWSQRVIYMKGAALRDSDLDRVRLTEAEACFILATRQSIDKSSADQHTILRTWAVRDYAPKCPQYVQIFRAENKMHVKHAEYVVCEDEFKYAMLANNCICPGISTLITLLLHTSRGEEGQNSEEEWHRVYGRHSGNEIYHIKVSQSKLLGEFVGKSFVYASFHAHRKYGIGLLAVQKDKVGSIIQLNPGLKHTLRGTDICYYMSITEEEQMTLTTKERGKRRGSLTQVASTIAGIGSVAIEMQPTESPTNNVSNTLATSADSTTRRPSIGAVPEMAPSHPTPQQNSEDALADLVMGAVCTTCGTACEEREYVKQFPPVTPYIGTSSTLCHLLSDKKPLCCLQLAQTCQHCSYTTANQYNWRNPAIILAADHASNGIYNFIIPLRAHYRQSHKLNPIVLLLKEKPQNAILDTISYFPQIYWMQGDIECIDNLLRAGIILSQHVVIVNKENKNEEVNEYQMDAMTVVAVQTMYRLFPQVRIFTELSQATNMRFMQFNAKDRYALHQSEIEKKEKERGSHIAFMFRLPFAAGNVFSATMLDTLLYQAYVKPYLIQFIRLLLGIDQAASSGYLTSIEISEEDKWIRTYGRLYQKLCSTDGDIPLGIYRTERTDTWGFGDDNSADNPDMQDIFRRKFSCKYLVSERHEIMNLVRNRLKNLGLPTEDYTYALDKRNTISYVIINPNPELKLQTGDIVYVIKPSQPLMKGCKSPSFNAAFRTKEKTTAADIGGKEVVARISTSDAEQAVPKLTITFSSPNDSASRSSTDDCEPEVQEEQTETTCENVSLTKDEKHAKVVKFRR